MSASSVFVVNEWCSGDGNGSQPRLQQKVRNVCNAVFDSHDPQALRCLSEAIVSEGSFDATLLAYLPFASV